MIYVNKTHDVGKDIGNLRGRKSALKWYTKHLDDVSQDSKYEPRNLMHILDCRMAKAKTAVSYMRLWNIFMWIKDHLS